MNQCTIGYAQSFLCAKCLDDFYRSGDVRTSDSECLKCENSNLVYVLVFLLGLCLCCLYVMYTSNSKMQQNEKFKLRNNSQGAREVTDQRHTVALRSLLTHLQILSLIGRFNFKWPKGTYVCIYLHIFTHL